MDGSGPLCLRWLDLEAPKTGDCCSFGSRVTMVRRAIITMFIFAAVTVFAALLHYSAGADRLRMGLTAPGFGWPRLLVVHLVAATSLAFLFPLRLSVRILIAFAFCASAISVVLGLAQLANLDRIEAGFLARLTARCIVSAGLVVLWVCAFRQVWGLGNSCPRLVRPALIMIAILPPAVFAERIQVAHRVRFQQYLATGRLMRARWELRGLIDLGQTQRIEDQSPVKVLRRLDEQILDLESQPSPGPAVSTKERLGHAFMLVQLDRLTEATAELKQLGSSDPIGLLLLGAVYRAGEKWIDAEATYRHLLTTVADSIAYEGLAESLVALGRPVEAEAVLREAL